MEEMKVCDVCGASRPEADMDEVPGIGYMCKPEFDCERE